MTSLDLFWGPMHLGQKEEKILSYILEWQGSSSFQRETGEQKEPFMDCTQLEKEAEYFSD